MLEAHFPVTYYNCDRRNLANSIKNENITFQIQRDDDKLILFNRFYFTKLYNENAEAYLESSRKFMMELFRENS